MIGWQLQLQPPPGSDILWRVLLATPSIRLSSKCRSDVRGQCLLKSGINVLKGTLVAPKA